MASLPGKFVVKKTEALQTYSHKERDEDDDDDDDGE